MDAQALIGKVLGNCLLQQVIGTGTMGVVYRATQSHPAFREVAVKVMTRAATLDIEYQIEFLNRFRGVIGHIAALEHPHIVPLYEHGDIDGLAYIVMADIEGETLEELLARRGGRGGYGGLDLSEALHYIEQIAGALDYAGAKGVIHQDLKPANIFIAHDNQALVADFHITSLLVEATTAPMRLSRPGMLDYMSPELITGKNIDRRADIYSLGAILFRMVTGVPVFQGQTLMKVATRHLRMPPPSPRALRPDLPVAAEQAILRALAKNPEDRYACARDLALLFRQAVQESARPIFTPPGSGLASALHPAQQSFQAQSTGEGATLLPRGLSQATSSRMLTNSAATGHAERNVPQPLVQPVSLSQLSEAPLRTAASIDATTLDNEQYPGSGTTDAYPQTGPQRAGYLAGLPSTTSLRAALDRLRRAATGAVNMQPQQGEAIAGKIGPITPGVSPYMPPTEEAPLDRADRGTDSARQLRWTPRPQQPQQGQATREENPGTTGTLKLVGPAKVLSIPVAGQPGQYVTGILQTQSLQESNGEATAQAKHSLLQRKKLPGLVLALLLLASLVFLLARVVPGRPAVQVKTAQTVAVGTPDLHATATARAAASLQASTIYYDPLSQNIHNWPVMTSGTLLYQFKDGAYHITDNDSSKIAPAILQGEVLTQPFTYTLTMQELRGDDTSVNNEFGMIVRFTAQQKNGRQVVSFYSFEVLNKNGGEYQFWKYDNSNGGGNPWKELANHPFGKEFHQGQGPQSINTFAIQVNGKNFTLIVNGKKVWSVSDGSLTSGGVGMLVNLKGTEVAFSNLRLTKN